MRVKKLLLFAAVLSAAVTAFAQGTAFTYQGRLQNNGAPANGNYDLRFSLYNTNTAGVALAGPVTDSDTAVTNGLFTVTIDFGTAFDGNNYWLDISVSPAGSNTFTELTPRQPILPTPYAMMANTASNLLGSLPASQLTGTVPITQLSSTILTNNESGVTLNGSFSGAGSGLTALNPANLSAGTAAINITGNAATASTAALASGVSSGASITGAFITNSTFAGNAGGLTNLNAAQLTGSVPAASLTSVPAANLTGTVPLAQLPSAAVTNTETGVTLGGAFSGTFSGNGSGLTNLNASGIATPTSGNYAYFYTTNTQVVATANIYQAITNYFFPQTNGWTQSGNTNLICAQTGLYLVQYSAESGQNGTGGPANNNPIISFRVTDDGTEIAGSQSTVEPQSAPPNGIAQPLSKSFIASFNSGDVIQFQITASTSGSAEILGGTGAGTTLPDFSVTIIRVR
jgi:hypothetical protein